MCTIAKPTGIRGPISPLVDRFDLPATAPLNSNFMKARKRSSLSLLEKTSSPATNSLLSIVRASEEGSNKRRKRSNSCSPSFEISGLFNSLLSTDSVDFPSLEWNFDMDSTTSKKTSDLMSASEPCIQSSHRRRGLVRSKNFQPTRLC
ncbi:expressed unknown protein [Seminavis robusta]|uniref:Uncharacterized protein n=1 Tax=Seminavis robusta TaxID=568900 RepID=A0A9N8HQ10_9STRA|nr:expressed unknown protein [Seminavis robusta]|eukprot:Sro1234_g254880.1 n/a (148) ;mRNA; r:9904-10347